MMQQKEFVECMISWVVDLLPKSNDDSSCDIEIVKIFLELYGYEALLCWPNPLSNSPSPQPPITLLDFIKPKDDAQRNVILDILIKKCNVLKYTKNKHLDLMKIETVPHTLEDTETHDEHQRKLSTVSMISDEQNQNENEETDEKEDDGQEVEEEEEELEGEAVNWIELFYSMLVESFSTADLYTDIIIMIGLFKARQQWWVTFMIAFLTAPYLVSCSALG
eukprot:845586_1